MMMKLAAILLQLVLFVTAAPFLSGLISRIKNNIRMRRGQSIFFPYFNLFKLFSKGEVISDTASWIFKAAPFIVLSSTLAAALLVPLCGSGAPADHFGDLLVLIFLLALGRFFLALSALDTSSAFAGMGSSREMFISSLAEPALVLAVFSLFLRSGSTGGFLFYSAHAPNISSLIASAAMFLVALAETSRIPVDNQETHLELTMVHEAMVLEYSGRRLALIEIASYIKQMIFFVIIARIIFPAGPAWSILGVLIIACAVALLEVSIAKMRLFRVADFLGFAFVLGIIASVCAILRI